ncbi:MAG TPA: HAD family hydrolase [Rubrobacteraceae bacterium]|nr:HAD family hydrolase [Rubrobacteraceae bacterium]
MRTLECEALLFDLDGVLVDSGASTERAWRLWVDKHELNAEEILKIAHGRRTVETVQLVAPHLSAEDEAAILEDIEVEDIAGIGAIPGAAELLRTLPAERWAVVTSGTRKLATTRLRQMSLPMPRVLVSAEDVANGKPEPECYLKAAQLLDVTPEDCLVIEDAPAGIDAAHAAGMRVIALTTTHSAEDISAAEVCTQSLEQVRPSQLPSETVDNHTKLSVTVGNR